MFSIKRSAQWFLANQDEITDRHIAIYTDSLASLKALDKPMTKSKLVYETMQLLNEVAHNCKQLSLRWVKAHSGHVNNDQADAQAVAAAKSDGPIVEDRPLVSIETAKTYIKHGVDHMWEFLYHRLTYPEECRQTKQWFFHISKRRSMRILKCTRLQWGKLVQLMTGHNFLARHNYVIDNDLDPHCPLCTLDYIQDSCHFFAECPIFLDIRLTLFKHRVLEPPFDDLPISDVLAFLLQSGSEALAWVA